MTHEMHATAHYVEMLNIGGKAWSVVWCDNRCDVDADNPGWYGLCSHAKKEIRCWKSGDATEDLDTLLHEVMHAIAYETRSVMSDEDNHNDLARFASMLSDTLVRNGMIPDES